MAIKFDDVALWNDINTLLHIIKELAKPGCVILIIGALMLLSFYLIGEANTFLALGAIIIGVVVYDRYFYKEVGDKK